MTDQPGDRTHSYHGVRADLGGETVWGFNLEVVEGDDLGASWESTGVSGTVGTHPTCDFPLSDPPAASNAPVRAATALVNAPRS